MNARLYCIVQTLNDLRDRLHFVFLISTFLFLFLVLVQQQDRNVSADGFFIFGGSQCVFDRPLNGYFSWTIACRGINDDVAACGHCFCCQATACCWSGGREAGTLSLFGRYSSGKGGPPRQTTPFNEPMMSMPEANGNFFSLAFIFQLFISTCSISSRSFSCGLQLFLYESTGL